MSGTATTSATTSYDEVARRSAAVVISSYSTSFGAACRLLAEPVRTHVRDVYALVRVADEIVDAPELGADVRRRADLLDTMTYVEDGVRRFQDGDPVRRLSRAEEARVRRAFDDYLETIPESKRFDRDLFYEVRDVVGTSGFGI